MTLWDKLNAMDRKWVYLFFLIVTVVPTLSPVILPVKITPYHGSVYDFVEEQLQAGDIVVMAVEYAASSGPTLHPPFEAITKHLLRKDIRAVFVSSYKPEGLPFVARLVDMYKEAGKEYGIDMINLGYTPGEEQAITSLAESFSKTVARDFHGTPLQDLPLANEISSAKEAKAIFQSCEGGLGPLGWVRQVHIPYKTPVASIVSPVMHPSALPYYQAGQLIGAGCGMQFAAEYEVLLEDPGAGLAAMGAQTFAHIYFVVLIVLGNIGWFMIRNKQQGGGR